MNISRTRLELTDDEVVLHAEIGSESSTFDARIGVDRQYVGLVDPGSNPFIPVATIGAAVVGEDLHVEDPISPDLRDGAQRAAVLYNEWWGHEAIAVRGPTAKPRFPRGPGRGLFFTRGVDSMFSLGQSITGAIEPFTHLIGVAGIDHWVSPASRVSTWDDTAEFADNVGLPIVRVTTNLREFLDPLAEWIRTHGTFLASFALALSPLFDSVVISSTQRSDHEIPLGSHSELDPLWSTERTSIIHYGSEFGRHEKVVRLANDPEMLEHLKVCWVADSSGNCGRCEKCLRTMTALAMAGCSPDVSFAAALSPVAIEEVDVHSERIAFEIRDELAPDIPDSMRDLRDAWIRTVDRFLAERSPGLTVIVPSEHLSRDVAHAILADVDGPSDRSVSWCLVDEQSADAVALADGLTRAWGFGLCYLSGVPWGEDQPPGLTSVERILRAARVRVWWSDGDELDAGRLTESVLSGCAPMQMMKPGAADVLRRRIPYRLRDCVVGWDPDFPPDEPDDPQTDSVIRSVVTALAAGSLNSESPPALT
ncbi:MAG: hypothetical protein M5U31_01730 [Acidimicrobiia bacterium]|nr:hypothetical protein [Acidimicrobiia bacterium]